MKAFFIRRALDPCTGGYGKFCSLPAEGWRWMLYVHHWILLLVLCFTAQAKAEIYKCKDAQGNIIYQQMPCPNGMIGKIEPPPPVPETDRQRAQERMERMIETSRQQDIAREQARQQQAEQARLLAEQEEEARLEAEREAQLRLEQEYRERHFLNMWPQIMPWPDPSKPQHYPRRELRQGPHDGSHPERGGLKAP